jgi:Uma2 family endonuclease
MFDPDRIEIAQRLAQPTWRASAGGLAADGRRRRGPCSVFVSNVKVRIGDIFYYPDLCVTCSRTDTDLYYSTEPSLIVEAMSPTTEAVDRSDKRLAYQSLPSLREYVLVS